MLISGNMYIYDITIHLFEAEVLRVNNSRGNIKLNSLVTRYDVYALYKWSHLVLFCKNKSINNNNDRLINCLVFYEQPDPKTPTGMRQYFWIGFNKLQVKMALHFHSWNVENMQRSDWTK